MIRPPMSLAEALRLPFRPGVSAQVLLDAGLEIKFTACPTNGPQVPHTRDEFYIIASGKGRYRVDGIVSDVVAGDLVFAAAGSPHGFEDFSNDFAIWIGFYGPEKPTLNNSVDL